MTIKKSLLAAATVTTVTLAGTGIAAAEELPTSTTASSASTKAEDGDGNGDNGGTTDEGDDEGLLGSMEGSTETLTIINDFGKAVAGSISILPNINDAVNDFQDMVDDIAGKIPNFPF